MFEAIDDEGQRGGGHMIVVFHAVTAGGGFQVALMGNSQRVKLHSQAVCAVVPAVIGWIAREPAVARPVERMYVKRGRVLANLFFIRVHLPQHLVPVAVAQLIVDGWRDGSDDWEYVWKLERKPQRALPAHAGAQKRDSRWGRVPMLTNPRHDIVQQMLLGSQPQIELREDAIGPPTRAGHWSDHAQAVLLEQIREGCTI